MPFLTKLSYWLKQKKLLLVPITFLTLPFHRSKLFKIHQIHVPLKFVICTLNPGNEIHKVGPSPSTFSGNAIQNLKKLQYSWLDYVFRNHTGKRSQHFKTYWQILETKSIRQDGRAGTITQRVFWKQNPNQECCTIVNWIIFPEFALGNGPEIFAGLFFRKF